MSDYREKIKNLLDLAQSPNEHEARDALLKARKLMAKYKISEMELGDAKEQKAETKDTGITYSIRRDPWVPALACVIAQNHCCKSIQWRPKGKQVATIGIIGLTNDADICMNIFTYAVECVRSVTNKLRKTKGVAAADGYGYGFTVGLDDAYSKQKEEGWALVLVTPKEVDEVLNKIPKGKAYDHNKKVANADARAFTKGVSDGHKFHNQKRIGEKYEQIGTGRA